MTWFGEYKAGMNFLNNNLHKVAELDKDINLSELTRIIYDLIIWGRLKEVFDKYYSKAYRKSYEKITKTYLLSVGPAEHDNLVFEDLGFSCDDLIQIFDAYNNEEYWFNHLEYPVVLNVLLVASRHQEYTPLFDALGHIKDEDVKRVHNCLAKGIKKSNTPLRLLSVGGNENRIFNSDYKLNMKK